MSGPDVVYTVFDDLRRVEAARRLPGVRIWRDADGWCVRAWRPVWFGGRFRVRARGFDGGTFGEVIRYLLVPIRVEDRLAQRHMRKLAADLGLGPSWTIRQLADAAEQQAIAEGRIGGRG